jgi:hypothetical protein
VKESRAGNYPGVNMCEMLWSVLWCIPAAGIFILQNSNQPRNRRQAFKLSSSFTTVSP